MPNVIQQVHTGANSGSYPADPADAKLGYAVFSGSNNALKLTTYNANGDAVLFSDTATGAVMAQTEIEFVIGTNPLGVASGGGIDQAGVGERCGGTISQTLKNSDGTIVARIVGVVNRFSGPPSQQGARVTFEAGIGTVPSSGWSDAVAELPDGFECEVGGFVFRPADVTHYYEFTSGSKTYITYRAPSTTGWFGGSSGALDPTVANWAATTYSASDRVKSADPDIELVTTAGGTDTTPAPAPDGDFGQAVSGGTLTDWVQEVATDTALALVRWTDPSASSGDGSKFVENLVTDLLV